MADNRLKLAAGLRNLPETAREDLAGYSDGFSNSQIANYIRKAGEQGAGIAKSVARGVPQMATGLVDLASLPFEAAGIIQPGQAVGSTKWLEEKGYLPPPQEGFINQTVEGLSSALDPSAMAAHALPAIGMLGKTVWHGSPKIFDEFNLNLAKEGGSRSARGEGLYFSESPDFASSFRAAGGEGGSFGLEPGPTQGIANLLAYKGEKGEELARKYYSKLENIDEQIAAARKAIDENSGLYKVDLPDEQIAKMIDYDLPLSQQSESVREALLKVNDPYINEALTTNPIYNEAGDYWSHMGNTYGSKNEALQDVMPANIISGQRGKFKSPQEVSQRFYEAGIPGTQYAERGTRNYVVFSDEIPQILERNNQPVAQALREYKQLESLNPTGTVMTEYNPAERATLPLGKNLTTLDVTSGVSPDEMVEIYRGVPQGVSEISPGDFITTNRQLAQDYAGGGNVISQKVPYRTILDDLTEPLGEEYIYRP